MAEAAPIPVPHGRMSSIWRKGLPLLIPMFPLLVVAALHRQGVSCGDDFPAHIQSWADAARQFRQGVLSPHWAVSAAYSAGEPRFIFYPPLSWMLGGLIELLAPDAHASIVFIYVALTMAGLAMFALARRYTSVPAAMLCAVLYALNPYMVLNAAERAAFAELLAATWFPLLIAGALRPRLAAAPVAIPLCLLWLTNVPSAVGGTYALVTVLALRVLFRLQSRHWRIEPETRRMLVNGTAGVLLGFILAAFFIVPAALQRPYVQAADAFTGGAGSTDFLFHRTGESNHDQTLHQVALIGICFLAMTIAGVLANRSPARYSRSDTDAPPAITPGIRAIILVSALISFFAMTPASAPLWHLPQLAYVHLPWRLLSILAVFPFLAWAVALQRWPRASMYALIGLPIAAAGLVHWEMHHFRRGCLVPAFDIYLAHNIRTGHGYRPTPEYTVQGASDALLRTNDPGFWLSTVPNAPASGTSASADPATDVSYMPGNPPEASLAAPAPHRLEITAPSPGFLILNLRDYPAWHVLVNGADTVKLKRKDGLIAVAVPPGRSQVLIQWHTPRGEIAGAFLSGLGVLILIWLYIPGPARRFRKADHLSREFL